MDIIPPIGPVQGKIWGTTQCIFRHNNVEMHRIRVDAGGFCSEHRHNHKWNRFFIISGKIKITIFRENGQDETVLTDGQCTDAYPDGYHVFEALEDTDAIEIYWVTLDPDDIERRTTGGKRGAEG